MKNINRLTWIMIVCFASVVLCMAVDFVRGTINDETPAAVIMTSSPVSFDRVDFSFTAPALQCSVPLNSVSANSLRTSFQTQRQNTTKTSRTGFTIIKAGKSMNEYSTLLFRKSIAKFPSGMNENTHRLISLGKLII